MQQGRIKGERSKVWRSKERKQCYGVQRVVLAFQWTCYGVTCLFCFDLTSDVGLWYAYESSGFWTNKYSVKLQVLNEYDVLKWSQTKSNNKNEKMGWI